MKTLEELEKSQDKILVLHYACTDVTKSPVIISSISIKNYSTGQTTSFSFDGFKDEKTVFDEIHRIHETVSKSCHSDLESKKLYVWNPAHAKTM